MTVNNKYQQSAAINVSITYSGDHLEHIWAMYVARHWLLDRQINSCAIVRSSYLHTLLHLQSQLQQPLPPPLTQHLCNEVAMIVNPRSDQWAQVCVF